MAKRSTIVLALIAMMTLASSTGFAQAKIAYVNMQQLIMGMPEAKRAFDTLQLYQQEMSKDGQELVNEFQAKLAKFQETEATLNADIKNLKIRELETAKANIEQYNAKMEQRLNEKEQQMTAPIIAKAKKAVADLAAEKGFVCVLDNSKDIVITATCEDLLPAAKQRLGIK
ncbi:OmpH family outer membrane protein [Chitinophaga rhizophila]|uniref:OmpH family outer membrane protein n=1 Tax=Chitinophaga rhizophila TaxID=2866212 RepID=A0ABS7GLR6_9BACT|nr:OmpH family outer membrane protein [Chitinophaga rhizophila]MBW8687764.1 OmpH family outer membrane protein [Chitinophaga rhizophila]